MKHLSDIRYLQVVNGYSLSSIVTLLEKLNEMIHEENSLEEGAASSLFFDGGAKSFDRAKNIYRYELEVYAVEIFESFIKFTEGKCFSVANKNLRCYVLIEKDATIKKEIIHFCDFYNFSLDGFMGLTLKDWDDMFTMVIYEVVGKLKFFIKDFEFKLLSLHTTDRLTEDQASVSFN